VVRAGRVAERDAALDERRAIDLLGARCWLLHEAQLARRVNDLRGDLRVRRQEDIDVGDHVDERDRTIPARESRS
jgi:hypothetical protein